ncbi:hypothetical protein ACSS6W_008806 [Trichoderma asperelloides]|uniref:3-hydroxyacyl-CoA dehydrogenase-like protein LAM1 n=1 Tax=Trichoderma asperellum TaxID=101201 RepID=A0A6V8QY20_TRIAP|nr:3-hydroxyacyl-CoA dehydrogenase-like protein LAM1 [Trichoderma asperellum]
MAIAWQPPSNYRNRPVAVLGAGVLGRRIACIWASAGYDVRIRDPSAQQRSDGIAYVEENVAAYAQKTGKTPGKTQAFENIPEAVENAWLVIEAVPEKIQLKIDTFAELDALTPADCILASNSSSYKSSEMIEKVSAARKTQILNMHYYMPPMCMIVELMTDGFTTQDIFPFMVERSKEAATLPFVARKESTGFIFNRLWAAIKRETLTILAEGVSVPEEIDSLWTEMFINGGATPCKLMDSVGLDTVAFIESHYVAERGLSPEKTVDFLQKNYLDHGKLGAKCAKGGFYPSSEVKPTTTNAHLSEPKIVVLDVGLAADVLDISSGGQILQIGQDGKIQKVLVDKTSMPDGIYIDRENGRMFWTCMGVMGDNDGAVYSANIDGTDIRTVVSPGSINTPKQLTIDRESKKIYFSDREGLSVFRCNFDGSDLELLIKTGDPENPEDKGDHTKWCVGIAVAPELGKFYWTQKGPSKGNKGRIFSANIATPAGQSAQTRDDIVCLLNGLPEPIDLEMDEETNTLYWTDRGEMPFGNSLNKVQLDEAGLLEKSVSPRGYEILTKHLKEAIGLKLDTKNGRIYIADLGGNIYQCDLNGGNKKVIHSDEYRAFTGIDLL